LTGFDDDVIARRQRPIHWLNPMGRNLRRSTCSDADRAASSDKG
jgi:hypothetical protein